MLAMNDAFASAHLSPEPLNYVESKGEMISLPCKDGKNANAYLVRPAKKSDIWLFIYHEWWGLNDYIKRESDRFATEFPGVNILAIDLYDGRVAEAPAIAQELMGGLKDERARSIINGALTYVGSKARIASLGWCMGGGWSLQSAIAEGKQAIGCVVYYGMPEKELSKIQSLQTDVFGIYAKKDQWINEAIIDDFKKEMDKAGKKFTFKWFDADHAFANPSNPKHDKIAAGEANKLVISYLRSHLK